MICYYDDMKERRQSKEVYVKEIEEFDFFIGNGYGSDMEEAKEEYLNNLIEFKSNVNKALDIAIEEMKLSLTNVPTNT